MGILGGSATLADGHGTGAAYGQVFGEANVFARCRRGGDGLRDLRADLLAMALARRSASPRQAQPALRSRAASSSESAPCWSRPATIPGSASASSPRGSTAPTPT
ncbi:sodium/glutamate symporter [Thiocapsa bogorovii]|nr:sodium/glutamate symporter [Thiocapsa bogorovii]UHD17623.1 sodium/glutamate symporter [Thiocapsa bogorovii]